MSQEKTFPFPKKLLVFVGLTIVLLALFQVVLSNRLATAGEQIGAFEEKKVALLAEKRRFEQEIIELTSHSRIASASAAIGLVKTDSFVNLSDEVPVALRP